MIIYFNNNEFHKNNIWKIVFQYFQFRRSRIHVTTLYPLEREINVEFHYGREKKYMAEVVDEVYQHNYRLELVRSYNKLDLRNA